MQSIKDGRKYLNLGCANNIYDSDKTQHLGLACDTRPNGPIKVQTAYTVTNLYLLFKKSILVHLQYVLEQKTKNHLHSSNISLINKKLNLNY